MKSQVCPRCEGERLWLQSTRDGSEYTDPETGERIRRTICIFRCECGMEFAHAFRKFELDALQSTMQAQLADLHFSPSLPQAQSVAMHAQ
jgi:hypothetical protein